MATIVLGAVGAFIGSGFGGTVLGLSGAVIGRAVGATLGRAIDQRLLGAGSEPVSVGRLDRLRMMASGQGLALPLVWGRMRVGGAVIWASPFTEIATQSGGGGGKGAPSAPTVTTYSYSVSLAIAVGEGVVTGIGRVWADGTEVNAAALGMRVYPGSETQLPDPKISAVVGAGLAPAYRGTAYVVFENLPLEPYGNRVPQFTFEVIRPAQGPLVETLPPFADAVRAVALIPGTGEYALATRPVRLGGRFGGGTVVNRHSVAGATDLAVSLGQLRRELPNCRSVSLVVSWFGDDLRCGSCRIRPKVEQAGLDSFDMPWRAGGIGRLQAMALPKRDGRSIYGGTPADGAVVEAIQAIRADGQEVMFYPFILMEQMEGNSLPNPYGGIGQPALPWRGRITTSVAPGMAGSPDRSATAAAEVAAFFGQAQPSHFTRVGGQVVYSGPAADWGLRRFILHYAHLCALAGGVDAFCIGSELRGLTQIRGAGDSFPAVAALRALAGDVRAILGPRVRISYAADWSEYAGFSRDGNRYFHLDPLWADPAIDFVGIDNYMPLTDWRQGEVQADAWRSPYDLRHLQAGIEGGEGFDWFYASAEGEAVQLREPITDGAGEPWIWRVKDIRSWWRLPHHERIGGVRQEGHTDWVPMSKPIVFTEYGCPAIDRGSNQPNLFFDAASSEGALPRASTGHRDDLMQMQYVRAINAYWAQEGMNPVSPIYEGPMLDLERAHLWAWDARPYPAFPLRTDVWADGPNYERGHWLNGRATLQPVEAVVAEIAGLAGLDSLQAEAAHGVVRGYAVAEVGTARAALQPVLLACGVDAVEREGALALRSRLARVDAVADRGGLAVRADAADLAIQRAPEAEVAGRLRLAFPDAGGDYQRLVSEAMHPDRADAHVLDQEVSVALLPDEARRLAERWLAELHIARETAQFALPPSALPVGVGDVVALDGRRWRIDRMEQAGALTVEGVLVEPGAHVPGPDGGVQSESVPFVPAAPVVSQFLDLPLLTGLEAPHAPHLAVTADPWPGRVALWSADGADGFALNAVLTARAVIGQTLGALRAARSGVWDRGAAVEVAFVGGTVAAAAELAVLNGANLAAIGDGSPDGWELFQFAGAELVAPGTWALTQRLRGLAGTDAVMPEVWPVGSRMVLLSPAVRQIALAPSLRGLERTWRIGAAATGFDDDDVTELRLAFDGVGLRPLSVAHLRAVPGSGGIDIRWIRRTRIDGDSWASTEVPLGEEREAYLLRQMRGPVLLREVEVGQASWTYPDAMRTADGPLPVTVSVAQLSRQFGPGPFRDVTV
jgi:hypothetical protein